MIAIPTTLLPGARLSSSINPRLAAHLLPRNGGIRASEEPLRTIAAWWNSIVVFFNGAHECVKGSLYSITRTTCEMFKAIEQSKHFNCQDWLANINKPEFNWRPWSNLFFPQSLELLLTCMCAWGLPHASRISPNQAASLHNIWLWTRQPTHRQIVMDWVTRLEDQYTIASKTKGPIIDKFIGLLTCWIKTILLKIWHVPGIGLACEPLARHLRRKSQETMLHFVCVSGRTDWEPICMEYVI